MKRTIVFGAFVSLLLSGCFSPKKVATSAENSVKAKGACLILTSLQKNYADATSNTPLASQAANEFRNGLEALKPLVPNNVQQAVTLLRATQTPVHSAQYNPNEKAARQTLDAYFQNKCGKTLQ